MNSVYKINKGINKPIEFKGLKAQYIGYLGIGVLLLLILFAFLFIIGINMFVCVAIILMLGTLLFVVIYRISDSFGQYGLLKKMAGRNIPECLKGRTRKLFIQLKSNP